MTVSALSFRTLTQDDLAVVVHDSFDALPADCIDLFARASDCSVFSTLPWYRNLATTVLARAGTIRVYVVREKTAPQRPLLIMPMWQPHPRASPMPFGERSLQGAANFYTSLFVPPACADVTDPAVVVSAWATLMVAERPRWDRVSIFPMSTAAPLYAASESALHGAGYVTQRYFCFGNWYLEVGGRTYSDYFKDLPAKLRNTVTRKSRALASTPGFRLAIITRPDQVAEGVSAFDQVYGASWKEPEPYPDFIPGLIAMCATEGWLRMGVAYLDELPIAFQIWIVHRRIASVYKLAYHEGHTKLSIGSVLTDAMMRYVIDEDKVSEVDYLTGDEPYKQDWMSARRERWGIVGFNPRTVRGGLAGIKSVIAERIKARKAHNTQS